MQRDEPVPGSQRGETAAWSEQSSPPAPAGAPAGSARTGPLPLHPMTVGDVLDGAFKLFKANAATVVLTTLAFIAPLQLLAAYVQRGFLRVFEFGGAAASRVGPTSLGPDLALSMLTGLVSLVVTPFVAGAISRVVGDSYVGRPAQAGAALRATLRRWWSLVVAWVLIHLVEVAPFVVGVLIAVAGAAAELPAVTVVGGLVAVAGGLAGFLIMALFVATAPAIVMEDIGAVAGMRRSWQLVRPRVWPVLGAALLAGLLAITISSVLGSAPMIASFVIGPAGWLLMAVGGLLGNVVALPIVAIVATLLYFDGRIRREGFDLEIMARELAGDPAR